MQSLADLKAKRKAKAGGGFVARAPATVAAPVRAKPVLAQPQVQQKVIIPVHNENAGQVYNQHIAKPVQSVSTATVTTAQKQTLTTLGEKQVPLHPSSLPIQTKLPFRTKTKEAPKSNWEIIASIDRRDLEFRGVYDDSDNSENSENERQSNEDDDYALSEEEDDNDPNLKENFKSRFSLSAQTKRQRFSDDEDYSDMENDDDNFEYGSIKPNVIKIPTTETELARQSSVTKSELYSIDWNLVSKITLTTSNSFPDWLTPTTSLQQFSAFQHRNHYSASTTNSLTLHDCLKSFQLQTSDMKEWSDAWSCVCAGYFADSVMLAKPMSIYMCHAEFCVLLKRNVDIIDDEDVTGHYEGVLSIPTVVDFPLHLIGRLKQIQAEMDSTRKVEFYSHMDGKIQCRVVLGEFDIDDNHTESKTPWDSLSPLKLDTLPSKRHRLSYRIIFTGRPATSLLARFCAVVGGDSASSHTKSFFSRNLSTFTVKPGIIADQPFRNCKAVMAEVQAQSEMVDIKSGEKAKLKRVLIDGVFLPLKLKVFVKILRAFVEQQRLSSGTDADITVSIQRGLEGNSLGGLVGFTSDYMNDMVANNSSSRTFSASFLK